MEDGDQPGLEVLHRLQPVTGLERALQRVVDRVGGVRLRGTHPPREREQDGPERDDGRPHEGSNVVGLRNFDGAGMPRRCHRAGTAVKESVGGATAGLMSPLEQSALNPDFPGAPADPARTCTPGPGR